MTSGSSKSGVMIYQSMSGDAVGTEGSVTATDSTLVATNAAAPMFYVTNSTGTVTLTNTTVTEASGVLVKAAAGQWGTEGANGGHAILIASNETLEGNLVADAVSTVALSLADGSTLTGAIDTESTAKSAAVTLDATSSWSVTADSNLTSLVGAAVSGTTVTNITGNGHTVTYDLSATENAYLGGATYTLAGGGTLTPAS